MVEHVGLIRETVKNHKGYSVQTLHVLSTTKHGSEETEGSGCLGNYRRYRIQVTGLEKLD